MAKFAVVKIGKSQYQVAEGDQLEVDRLREDKDKSLTLDQVLLWVDGEKVKIGDPLVKGASVKAKVIDHFKGEKIRVATYKAKSRYRRVKGFRPDLTRIEISKITA